MPVPALAFCAWFWLSVATFNSGIDTRLTIEDTEKTLFGKSVIRNYLRTVEQSQSSPAPPSEAPAVPPTAGAKDVDFGPYMATIQHQIKKNWHPPKGNESKHIVVQFKVLKDGTMKNLKVVKSSGLAKADAKALEAVQTSSFPRLPEGAPSNVDIEFTFDYNVFNHERGASDPPQWIVEWLAIARRGDAVRRPEVVTVPQSLLYHRQFGLTPKRKSTFPIQLRPGDAGRRAIAQQLHSPLSSGIAPTFPIQFFGFRLSTALASLLLLRAGVSTSERLLVYNAWSDMNTYPRNSKGRSFRASGCSLALLLCLSALTACNTSVRLDEFDACGSRDRRERSEQERRAN